ncbi:hypothetical protein BRX36_02530 [Sphingomonas sp. S-NIH.Pt1_0416]|uniref:hypothetical protein n=1 Tax=Sphingomonas sp. S-NIH.Pt1_0416 TaxID=1920123 RepID=UPI000F7DB27E|nr:hypothetical protein [Sphingomonas sp. S-NIH.Pt1_0416]RSU68436.1 hypothetical protein BRX36_02530 [Sphingomonas sp. S-NIH.Pt1_0416]
MAYYAAARSASIGMAAAGGDESRPGKFDAAHLIGGCPPAPVRTFDAAFDPAAEWQGLCGQDGAWPERPAMCVAEQFDDPVVAGEVGLHVRVPIDKDVAAGGERDADRPVGDGQVELNEEEVAFALFDNGGDLDRLGKFFTST